MSNKTMWHERISISLSVPRCDYQLKRNRAKSLSLLPSSYVHAHVQLSCWMGECEQQIVIADRCGDLRRVFKCRVGPVPVSRQRLLSAAIIHILPQCGRQRQTAVVYRWGSFDLLLPQYTVTQQTDNGMWLKERKNLLAYFNNRALPMR